MTMKTLITARLAHLGITAYRASRQARKKPSWISNIGESPKLSTVIQVAFVLGLPVKVLIEGGEVTAYPPPAWLAEARERSADREALASVRWPKCPACGRHRRLVSGGICGMCWQRGRRATGRA